MNKNDLVDVVSAQTKMTKADTQRVIEGVCELTRKMVKKGEPLRLVGFGTFQKAKRNARKARNPQTGAVVEIAAHWVPRFKPGTEFKEYLR